MYIAPMKIEQRVSPYNSSKPDDEVTITLEKDGTVNLRVKEGKFGYETYLDKKSLIQILKHLKLDEEKNERN